MLKGTMVKSLQGIIDKTAKDENGFRRKDMDNWFATVKMINLRH